MPQYLSVDKDFANRSVLLLQLDVLHHDFSRFRLTPPSIYQHCEARARHSDMSETG
jgi:hypothetical protein